MTRFRVSTGVSETHRSTSTLELDHGPWSSTAASPEDRLILARLPLHPELEAEIVAGPIVDISRAAGVTGYLWGEPYFRDPWLNRTNLAERWIESPDRMLDLIDGSFMLLIHEPDGFKLINDKVSALTWYCTQRGDWLWASNSLGHLMQAADVPFDFDYHAYRHYIYTRSHHYDLSLIKNVFKLLKGHYLDQTLEQKQYYDLRAAFETDITPEQYLDHLRDVISQTMRGKEIGVLASNGFDSRFLCLLLSQNLDHFHIFSYGADTYSETGRLEAFLKLLPMQNYTLHKLRHSMAAGSPHFTPRKLIDHADLFLDCFVDLSGNKEHLLYLDAFAQMTDLRMDHVVTGCMAGHVRRSIPLYLMELRESDMEQVGTDRTRELFGVTNEELEELYHGRREDDDWVDDKHYLFGDAQTNYTHPLMLNYGLVQNSLAVYTARALELYRGIDRQILPGRGGVNLWREYLNEYLPHAEPVPYDTGITLDVPLEHDPWIPHTIDVDAACRVMRESGDFDPEFIDLIRDTYGIQRPPYSATQTFLNLWGWYANLSGRREAFIQSLAVLRRRTTQLQRSPKRRVIARLADWSRIRLGTLTAVCDRRHPVYRLCRWCKLALRYRGYAGGSAIYGGCRRLLGLPPHNVAAHRLRS